MATHDPQHVLERLRDHLTQPEANIAFLLGAGTSCSVQVADEQDKQEAEGNQDDGNSPKTRALIPNVAHLTAICEKEIQKLDAAGEVKRFGPAFEAFGREAQPSNRAANIEDILSCVRRKLHAISEGDTLSGLSKADLGEFEKVIRGTIASQVNPVRSSFPLVLPHESFVRWIARMPRAHPVEIFTTNYDVLIETALEAERVPAFDGFVGCNQPFFSHETLTRPESSPAPSWTRLWKIHGSITWKFDTIRGRQRVVRTQPHNEGEMILPSHHKYDESRKQPYSALLERLSRVLDREDAVLIVCGYSFSDDHINAIIFDALEAKRRPHVIALQYVDPDQGSLLAERAARFLNLMVLGPQAAYLGGRHGKWKLSEVHAAAQLANAFKLDEPDHGKAQSGYGRLLLGDFAQFAEFLSSLTSAA